MPKYTKSPYAFEGCHVCTVSRRAESRGVALSEKELIRAFEIQAARSKIAKEKSKKVVTDAK